MDIEFTTNNVVLLRADGEMSDCDIAHPMLTDVLYIVDPSHPWADAAWVGHRLDVVVDGVHLCVFAEGGRGGAYDAIASLESFLWNEDK